MPVIRPHIVAMLSKKSMKNGVQQDKNARKESKLVGPTMRQFIKMIVMIMIMNYDITCSKVNILRRHI